jgi:membrane protein YqaA with SNARE-associated domain
MVARIKALYNWMQLSIHSPYADYILGFLFYIEAIFFLPTDPILIFYCVEKRDHAFRYAAIATICSVLGGLTGYALGAFLWDTVGEQIIHNRLINYIITPGVFHELSARFKEYEWWAIITAGFTPIIPYKVTTLTAGFCKISPIPFIIGSLIARGTRFFCYAIGAHLFDTRIKKSIQQSFNIIVALFVFIIIGALLLLHA